MSQRYTPLMGYANKKSRNNYADFYVLFIRFFDKKLVCPPIAITIIATSIAIHTCNVKECYSRYFNRKTACYYEVGSQSI